MALIVLVDGPEVHAADIPPPEPLTNLFLERSRQSADKVIGYSKIDGRWVGSTWGEVRQTVEEISLGLLELGAERGERVAVLSNTRSAWGQADMAILCLGGITIGIYPTLTGPQTRYLLDHAGVRFIFVENRAQRTKVREATQDREGKLTMISFEEEEGGEDEDFLSMNALRRLGARRRRDKPEEFERRARENKSSDVVTYVYTSGTTGEPKGAMLTHQNFHYVAHATSALVDYNGETSLVFLPLAHSLQRYVSYLALIKDVRAYYAEGFDRVPDNIREVRPTCFAVVPRVLEKIYARVLAMGREAGGVRTRIFERSLSALRSAGADARQGREPKIRARLGAQLADRLVGQRVRESMGGRVKFLGCGSAPLAREVHEFFEDIGIPILEGYGLTETSAPVCINTLNSRRIGTVGRAIPGTYLKIAPDGEILVRGPGVFSGYYQNDTATQEAFDEEGWFRTGDIGHLSRGGFLTITDRKKDLIITAGGKNIAPGPIEHKLKRDVLVGQAVVVGDRQPYLTALLSFDSEIMRQVAKSEGLPEGTNSAELMERPAVRARIEDHVARVNENLPRFEQIKKWDVLPGELSIEGGELTPTLKVKRRVVHERYQERIDRLYST